MMLFGFVVATTLVNTLFLFDLYVTKFTQRKLWGSTLYVVLNHVADPSFRFFGFMALIIQWGFALTRGNDINFLQFTICILWWAWFVILYIATTHAYYSWEINKKEE